MEKELIQVLEYFKMNFSKHQSLMILSKNFGYITIKFLFDVYYLDLLHNVFSKNKKGKIYDSRQKLSFFVFLIIKIYKVHM